MPKRSALHRKHSPSPSEGDPEPEDMMESEESDSDPSLQEPGLFDGLTAWFSSSVSRDRVKAWKDADGKLASLADAMYVFSEDATAADTVRAFESEQYLNENMCVFHAMYIDVCLERKDLSQVKLGVYSLPPMEIQTRIRHTVNFPWEAAKPNVNLVSSQVNAIQNSPVKRLMMNTGPLSQRMPYVRPRYNATAPLGGNTLVRQTNLQTSVVRQPAIKRITSAVQQTIQRPVTGGMSAAQPANSQASRGASTLPATQQTINYATNRGGSIAPRTQGTINNVTSSQVPSSQQPVNTLPNRGALLPPGTQQTINPVPSRDVSKAPVIQQPRYQFAGTQQQASQAPNLQPRQMRPVSNTQQRSLPTYQVASPQTHVNKTIPVPVTTVPNTQQTRRQAPQTSVVQSPQPSTPPQRRNQPQRTQTQQPETPPQHRTQAQRPESPQQATPPQLRTQAQRPQSPQQATQPQRRTQPQRQQSPQQATQPQRRTRPQSTSQTQQPATPPQRRTQKQQSPQQTTQPQRMTQPQRPESPQQATQPQRRTQPQRASQDISSVSQVLQKNNAISAGSRIATRSSQASQNTHYPKSVPASDLATKSQRITRRMSRTQSNNSDTQDVDMDIPTLSDWSSIPATRQSPRKQPATQAQKTTSNNTSGGDYEQMDLDVPELPYLLPEKPDDQNSHSKGNKRKQLPVSVDEDSGADDSQSFLSAYIPIEALTLAQGDLEDFVLGKNDCLVKMRST